MQVTVIPYSPHLEDNVKKLSHKAWLLFKYNKDYEHQKMGCVIDESGEVIAVGYLRHGEADDHDVMEIVIQVNEETANRFSDIRRVLYPYLIETCSAIRNPAKKTKLVAWDDFDGDRQFYMDQGFSPFQQFYFAKRSIDKSIIPHVDIPSAIDVRHNSMKERKERIAYTVVENQYYQGVLYRSVDMLEWMMGGPELHTISAFEGDELVGSVMCWQTGAVERLFVIPRWRNKGLESVLLSKAFEYHQKQGRNNVETLINIHDKDGMVLLESVGYSFPVELELMALDI
jgi:GNAT superfamily N-acetyltransferase